MARFYCLFCDKSFELFNHHCQPECRPVAGVHVDVCKLCKSKNLEFFESQIQVEKEDDQC